MIEDSVGIPVDIGATIRGHVILAPLGERNPPRTFRARRGAEAPVVLKLLKLPTDPGRDATTLEQAIALRVQRIEAVRKSTRQRAGPEAAGVGAELPVVTAILDHWQQDGHLFVVTEQFGQRSLRDSLEDAGTDGLDLDFAIDLAIMAVKALVLTHETTYHLNIKPSNLRFDSRLPFIRLTDFNLLDHEPARDEEEALTYTWTPERLSGELAYNQSDVYSMAATVYALLTGGPPYRCTTLDEASRLHTRGKLQPPNELRPQLPAALSDCLMACLDRRPAARPPAARLLAYLEDARTSLGLSPGAAADRESLTGVEAAFWPQLKVKRGGHTLKHRLLDSSGLTLSGQNGNTPVLEDPDLADTRIQVDWDGVMAWFVCEGETAPVMFEGAPVQPQKLYDWPTNSELSVGNYDVTIVPPAKKLGLPEGPKLRAASAVDVPAAIRSSRLEVRVQQQELRVVPGEPVPLAVLLSNRGAQVDTLTLAMEGIPQGWVTVHENPVRLNPGDLHQLMITVNPPRDARSAVGIYQLAVRASSALAPREYQRDTIRLVVGPFFGCHLALRPDTVATFSEARFGLIIQNDGNAPARFRVSAEDPRGRLAFTQRLETVELAAGARQIVPLKVRARPWHLFGPPIERPFNVKALSSNGEARAETTGKLAQWALIPPWLPWLLAALLALSAILTYLSRPFARLDAELEGWPLYGILNPPPPTQPPTLTPTLEPLPLLVAPLVLPSPLPTVTPTATLRPSPTLPPPSPTPTSPPTETSSPTPSVIPTPAPAINGALIECPRELPIIIEGQFSSQQRYVLDFHDYAASLGVFERPEQDLMTGPDGRFTIPLIIGTSEAPGIYRVRVRGETGEVPRIFYCRLLPPGVRPPPPPPSTATPRPTATPFFSPTPTATLPSYIRPPWPTPPPTATSASPTPAPVADGAVRECTGNEQLTIEGKGPPGTELTVTVDGIPLADEAGPLTFGPIADDGTFVITPNLGSIGAPRVVEIVVTSPSGKVRGPFYCAVYNEPLTGTPTTTLTPADALDGPTPTPSTAPMPIFDLAESPEPPAVTATTSPGMTATSVP